MDVELIAETKRAILVRFDEREAWLPKAWIVAIKTRDTANTPVIARALKSTETIFIKISEYHWTRNFL